MAVTTCHTDLSDMRNSWTEYSFSGETKVRPGGPVEDPADLDIAYESAKTKADTDAARYADSTPGEPEYDVYVRVVRRHRQGWGES